MASTSKRQQTMAKRSREQAVREKRAKKLAKKYAAAEARNGTTPDTVFGPRLTNPEPTPVETPVETPAEAPDQTASA